MFFYSKIVLMNDIKLIFDIIIFSGEADERIIQVFKRNFYDKR